MNFADNIIATCKQKNSRLMVGLDPHWNMIPDSFKANYNTDDTESIVADYLTQAIDVCHPYAAAFKPQIAFFEQYGLAGFRALDRVLKHLATVNAIVVMDAKRNDIGSTAQAYARTYFGDENGPGPFDSHGLTVNGYLGSDGIKPFLKKPEKGIFVLVKTSNPSSGEIQDVSLNDKRTVAHLMAQSVSDWNKDSLGTSGYGNVGAVIGATWPEHMKALRGIMHQSLLLVPGYGAQGGDDAAVAAAFNPDSYGALINSSRGILFPADYTQHGFAAVETAAAKARDHILDLAKN